MLIGIMRNIWNAAQILADELAKNTIALSMKNADSWHTHQDGIINEILHGIQSLITTHASYVQILMEVGLVGIDGLAGLLADAVRSQVLLALLGLIHILHGSRGVLQSVEAHLGSHASENGGGSIAIDALHLSYGGQALDADGIAHLNLALAVGLYLVLGIAQGSRCLLLVLLLLSLSLGMALLALLNLGYLLGYLIIRFLGVNLLIFLFEGIKFLTDAAGLLLLRLTLSNLSDGILNLLVALLQQFGCFLIRLLED